MKKVLINVEERELRVAIMEDDQLVELYIESLDEKSILNNIYKGRVEDVLPGLKAAFVNVGLDRNAFLHFDDVRPDLLWGKYRELNPEMADEVPTAREALAGATEGEAETDSESADKRKRRRGRRGGKKRRPDSEDSYTPGLPVGVTEDDLEDDEEEETDSTSVAATPAATTVDRTYTPPSMPAPTYAAQAAAAPQPDQDAAHHVSDQQHDEQPVSQHEQPQGQHGQSEEEIEARKQARMEKQRQRRERWEQKKLERQQRRQQERADRQAQAPSEAETAPEPAAPLPPPVYGTRAAASAYDSYTPYSPGNQRRQNKARYGENFGNVAVNTQRRHDHRDSQVDFFGPATAAQEEQQSIWDERQPNLGPVPGIGKAFLPDMNANNRNDRRSGQRPGQGGQQNQNRNKKFGGPNNKRRGGKKRSMRKRDNRSYFAFSADDIENDKPLVETTGAETKAPAKPVRKRKSAADTTAEKPARKTAAKKPAAKKTAAAKTPRKKKSDDAGAESAPQVIAQELPLNIPTEAAPAAEEAAAPKKTTRTRKPAATRARKSAAPATEAEAKSELSPAAESAPQEQKAPADSKVEPAVAQVKEKPTASKADNSPASVTESVTDQATPAVLGSSEPASEVAPEASTEGGASAPPRQRRNNRPTRAERAARHRERKAEAKRNAGNGGESTATAESPEGNDTATAEAQAPQTQVTEPKAEQHHPREQHPSHPRREQRRKLRRPYFQEVFKKGDEIMVQVVKEEIGLKGARISSYVSLPGRYLVLLPYPNQEGGISRKVEDVRERKRLKSLLRDISSDETAFIVRTAGIYQEEKEIRNDVEFLSGEWKTIADRFAKAEPTSLVYDDHDILYRLARDVFDDSVTEIQIDSFTECEKLKQILGKLIPGLVDKVKLYSGPENIFHKFGVTKQIQKAARRKVWLKSGGYLIIDEAEALTAIDVNTGKSVGKDDQEKLILRTNLEASRAVARELKLRDIGGLIVIDFIDMKDARNKEQVLSELKLQLRKDRSKTSVSAISEFGLVEMTRKRVRRSLRKTLFMDCPYCQGAGVVLNEQQIWLHMKHEVLRQLELTKPAPSLAITVNPRIRAYIDQNYREVIRRLEQKYDTEIRITMSDIFHIENYQIESLDTTAVIAGSATVPTR